MNTPPARGFGLIGTGSIAQVHAAAIQAVPGAELRAVYNRSADKARTFAAAHGGEAVPTLAALLARPDIAAVCITTPTGAHGEATLAALAAGKHVLCEKPLEIDLPRIDAMIAAAARHDRILSAVFQARFGAGARAVKRAVEAGRFGRLTLCSAYIKWWRTQQYYDDVHWRGTWALDGGGALMNQGIHAVDLLQWLVGLPVEVSAFAGTLAHGRMEAEDTLVANLRFAHGALGSLECATSVHPGFAKRLELSGDAGTVVLEDDTIKVWQFRDPLPEDDAIRGGAHRSDLQGGASDPKAISQLGHRLHIADLVDAIRENRPPAIPGAEARHAVRLIRAIYQSVAESRPVNV